MIEIMIRLRIIHLAVVHAMIIIEALISVSDAAYMVSAATGDQLVSTPRTVSFVPIRIITWSIYLLNYTYNSMFYSEPSESLFSLSLHGVFTYCLKYHDSPCFFLALES
jgi:hypothetical protein